MSGPFARSALAYLDAAEIGSPLPIFFPKGGTKQPLVAGHHGYHGAYADADTIRSWITRYPAASIGLRLHAEVVGIDVDGHSGKRGIETIAELQWQWGALPPTWKTTARPTPNGIWLYRVPLGAAAVMRDPLRGAVEIVTYGQRYITCYPSVHPTVRKVYHWVDPEGHHHKSLQGLRIADLAPLPAGWITGLSTAIYADHGKVRNLSGTPMDWLRARPSGHGRMCEAMRRDARRYRDAVRAAHDGSCYSAMVRGVLALVGNAAEGHRGGFTAVEKLFSAYVKTIEARPTQSRSRHELQLEFTRAARNAIEKLPDSKFSEDDACEITIEMRVNR